MAVLCFDTCIRLCLLQCFIANIAVASHIVGFPNLNFVSHSRGLWKIGQELASRGHRYTQILPDCSKDKSLPDIDVVIFNTSVTSQKIENLMLDLMKIGDIGGISGLLKLPELFAESNAMSETFCDDLFRNVTLIEKLKESVDLILCDLSCPCCSILAEVLEVPQVAVITTGFVEPLVTLFLEMPESLIHMHLGHGNAKMSRSNELERFSFVSRLKKIFTYPIGYWTISKTFYASDIWEKHAKSISKYNSATEAYWKMRGLVLVNHDFSLTSHRPLNANVKIIGPLLPGPAQPLSAELESFMAKGKRVVLVSFGTVLSQYRMELVTTLAAGLGQLPVQVLWKHTGTQPSNIGKNTKVVPWFPQNDLLGHQSTVVFLTHGGVNSLHESVYHGVPVVVLPIFGDQHWSAGVCVEKDIGRTLNKDNLTPAQVTDTISDVINNAVYKQNVMKISKMLKSRKRTPPEEGADWVEYALDTDGAAHLRSPAADLPFYQLHMLDVFLFILLITLLCVFLIVKLCKWLCCRQKGLPAEKEKLS